MIKPKDNLLSIYEFGRQLIDTQDLDPVYVTLFHAEWKNRRQLERWLLAYFCFYHCGTASWITDQGDYWEAMETAAGSKTYLRSSERRHFRGSAALKSVAWLRERGVPTLFEPFNGTLVLKDVMDYVKTWYGFGDWIAFKVADILERLNLCKVVFKPEDVFSMFESPRKGAEAMAERHGPATGEVPMWAHNKLKAILGNKLAPPSLNRPVNIQELETVLCKWKSYLGGHYHVGKDIHEVRRGLLTRATCPTVQKLYAGGRVGKLW